MSFFHDFHFLRPGFFLWVIPLALLFILLKKQHQPESAWQKMVDPKLLPFLLESGKVKQSITIWGLGILGCSLTLFALAGPTYKKVPQAIEEHKSATMVVLDSSLSMGVKDVSPNRLERAKHKITDFLNINKEGYIGLVIYAGDAYVVSPLTDDRATLNNLMPMIELGIMPDFGSNAKKGLEKAQELLTQSGGKNSQILWLTDGIRDDQITPLAELISGKGMRVSILGIGTSAGAPIPTTEGGFAKDNLGKLVLSKLESTALEKLSEKTDSKYIEMTHTDEDLQYLTSHQIIEQLEKAEKLEVHFDEWEDLGPLLAILLLPLAALSFRKGWLTILILFFLLPTYSAPSHAGIWEDLWHNNNQQAYELYQNKKPYEAAQKFEDKNWKGAAFYNAQKYDQAEKFFELNESEQGHYNHGNALAKQGKIQAAIEAYQTALKINPKNEKALFNKQLLETLLEKEKDNEKNQQGKKPDENQQNNEQKNKEQEQDPSGKKAEQEQNNQDSVNDKNPTPEQNQASKKEEKDKAKSSPEKSEQEKTQDKNDNEKKSLSQQDNQTPDERKPTEEKRKQEQLLNRVPDDPAGLLRRKFYLQSKQKNGYNDEPVNW